MALGAAAHPADVLDRLYCHEIFRFWSGIEGIERQEARQFGGYRGIVENDNSGIAGGAVFFSIPESSEARIPRCHCLQRMRQERGMLSLTHSCFVLDDGGGWTLNGPLPTSNGWSASPRCPTPGH